MAKQLKKIDITKKNKQTGEEYKVGEYVTVGERIVAFRELSEFKHWSIITEMDPLSSAEHIIFRCEISNAEGRIVSSATAEEYRSDNVFVNKFSAIENCETSSVGRALGFLGIGLTNTIASVEEIENNINKHYDFVMAALKGEPKKDTIAYVNSRLKDTEFSTEQRREVMKAFSAMKTKLTVKNQ